MTTDDWTPAAQSITTSDERFFATADFVLPATIDLPPRSRGARRTIRLLRSITIDEEFHIWEEQRRIGFRALDIRPHIAGAWAEQAELHARPDGGTHLTYTFAINAPMLSLVPRVLKRPAAALSRRALRRIVSVLPSPAR